MCNKHTKLSFKQRKYTKKSISLGKILEAKIVVINRNDAMVTDTRCRCRPINFQLTAADTTDNERQLKRYEQYFQYI